MTARPDHRKLANGDVVVIDARARFAARAKGKPQPNTCRECGAPGQHIVLPRIDHRRRKPWPQPYWLCAQHGEVSRERAH